MLRTTSDRTPTSPYAPNPGIIGKTLPRIGFSLVAGFAAMLVSIASGTAEVLPQPLTVDPVVLMREGSLEGCGLDAAYRTRGNTASVKVIAMRAAGGVTFQLRGSWTKPGHGEHGEAAPRTLLLQTGTWRSNDHFPAATTTATDPDTIATQAALPGITGARFIQSVMISGATVEMTNAAGETLKLDLPGPLPQRVRASYLNCTGDLYRPVGESRGSRKER